MAVVAPEAGCGFAAGSADDTTNKPINPRHIMLKQTLRAVAVASVLLSLSTFAAPGAKTYQVTGPVLEVTETTITVQKGD